ncbi:MAG TPA: 4-(cytidine 5'-diphospho)-2-C-methyl-D-erythritol kinase [Chloroflexota bacterium]|nr:4-(cytidine 5'-diphospho)-2-C-methyl-D-erythritol kinase [Chloroflexota bacterium]
MSRLRVSAHAKINLSLEVLGRRPDGFHEVRSVMQSISLADELTLEAAVELSLTCNVVQLEGEDNLVMRAARALQGVAGGPLGARIHLEKGIPEASGLGGASSDAASALVGLSRLWGLDPGSDRLRSLGAELGSDVPFFLTGGTALVRGRGEVVVPLHDAPLMWLLLLVPPHDLSNKTATLYRLLGPEDWSFGERTEELVRAIADGRAVDEALLGNSFEAVAEKAFAGMATYREAMLSAGVAAVHLSGAGPTLYSIFGSERSARDVAERLAGEGYRPLLAHTMGSVESMPRVVDVAE